MHSNAVDEETQHIRQKHNSHTTPANKFTKLNQGPLQTHNTTQMSGTHVTGNCLVLILVSEGLSVAKQAPSNFCTRYR